MATTQPFTVDELMHLPDDGYQHEIVHGELVNMPPAGEEHGDISQAINHRLLNWEEGRNRGKVTVPDTGFVVTSDSRNVYMPDVAYIRLERLPPDRDRTKFIGTHPDVAVEIVSPSDRVIEVVRKVRTYLDAGVSMVLLVDPQSRSIDVHSPDRAVITLTDDDEFDGGDVLPGFSFRVGDIFPSGQ